MGGGGGWESMGNSSMGLILAGLQWQSGTLTSCEGVYDLRIRDNAFKSPGDVQLLGTASKHSANGSAQTLYS